MFYIKGYYSYNGSAEEKEARLSAITEKSKEFVNGDKDVKTEIMEAEDRVFLLQLVHIPLRNKYIDFLKTEMLNKMGLNITPSIVERKFPR
ncbi:MAG: hypothetical protein HY096_01435 [Nitrospinae bacterium]|nr:hypothetical protein [Nitrospinota bacterium]